ncbi:MAG: hypothetical protein K9H49_14100 [Bacteroidales bacterium]|nr:hypothetical protein [Bacteroidales bacterium]MCF8390826.1 hypothetical protein [Bacteroidales bacterium]
METQKRHRITKWLNIFLLVINVSAITTIIGMNKGTSTKIVNDQFSSDEFLKKELNLTPEQYRTISELDAKIFRSYQALLDMQCEEQFKLLYELTQENPSPEKLDSLATKIGKIHTGIKRQTIKHFINIKSICDEDQEELLNKILIGMMEMEEQCKYCNKAECDRRNQIISDKK